MACMIQYRTSKLCTREGCSNGRGGESFPITNKEEGECAELQKELHVPTDGRAPPQEEGSGPIAKMGVLRDKNIFQSSR